MSTHSFRATLLHFTRTTHTPETDFSLIEDGLLVTRNGKIVDIGDAQTLMPQYAEATHHDFRGKLLVPGLIDTHVHFPQTEMIARYGEQLLSWLKNYTFPTEQKFAEETYAEKIADVFLRQLLRNGTTTAMVYGTVHKRATDILFEQSSNRNMLTIAGKVCMDRHCPEPLRDSPEKAQRDSAELIDKWHGKQRQFYAITPRFAPTSSPAQMTALGELAKQYPDVFIQTHLSENEQEIAWVQELYPERKGYLDVYDHYNLVRQRAVFGHCLHLTDDEWRTMAERDAVIACCPTSNLFLGSGLFAYERAMAEQVAVTLATDVGAGTSFNMLRTYGEAYKICQLQSVSLSPLAGLYRMTQGAACALQLEQHIGNLNVGSDADFVVMDPQFDELSSLRHTSGSADVNDTLFGLAMLGDDRAVMGTWVAGINQYLKQRE